MLAQDDAFVPVTGPPARSNAVRVNAVHAATWRAGYNG